MKHYIAIIILILLPVGLFSNDLNRTIEYRHEVLGFSISYPADWYIMKSGDFYQNFKRIKLEDKKFQEMLARHAHIPFFAVTKYKEPYDDLNPSLKVNTRPYGKLKGVKLDLLLNTILSQYKNIFKDFRVVKGTSKVKIGGHEAFYSKIAYTLVAKNGAEFPAISELWMIDRGEYFYIIGIGRKQNGKKSIKREIQNMIDSIRIK